MMPTTPSGCFTILAPEGRKGQETRRRSLRIHEDSLALARREADTTR